MADGNIWVRRKDLTAVSGTDNEFRFAIDAIIPGTWQAIVKPMGFRQIVEVSPQGELGIVLEVPAPAQAILKLTDAQSGKPMPPGQSVTWHTKPPKGVSGWSSDQAKFDTERNAYLFSAPAGTVSVSAHSEGYVWTTRNFTLQPGDNEIHMALPRSCGVLISAKCEGRTIPIGWDWNVSLSEVGGKGRSRSTSSRGTSMVVSVSHPGRYTFRFGESAMYKMPQGQVVEIPAETIVPVTIELELKR